MDDIWVLMTIIIQDFLVFQKTETLSMKPTVCHAKRDPLADFEMNSRE
jgi:hypothetical protein